MRGLILIIALAISMPAMATPGALNSRGCHKGHCHGFSNARKYGNGRHYIPGHFTHGASKKRSKRRR